MVLTGSDVARVRTALVLALAGVAAVVAAGSLAPAMSPQAIVLLTALSAAAALVGVHGLVAVPAAGMQSLRPPRRATAVPLVLAGRTTDAGHHPVRPRAPGLV